MVHHRPGQRVGTYRCRQSIAWTRSAPSCRRIGTPRTCSGRCLSTRRSNAGRCRCLSSHQAAGSSRAAQRRAGKRSPLSIRKRVVFCLSAFLMFVPSLSWSNDGILSILLNGAKRRVFIVPVSRGHRVSVSGLSKIRATSLRTVGSRPSAGTAVGGWAKAPPGCSTGGIALCATVGCFSSPPDPHGAADASGQAAGTRLPAEIARFAQLFPCLSRVCLGKMNLLSLN